MDPAGVQKVLPNNLLEDSVTDHPHDRDAMNKHLECIVF